MDDRYGSIDPWPGRGLAGAVRETLEEDEDDERPQEDRAADLDDGTGSLLIDRGTQADHPQADILGGQPIGSTGT